MDLQILDARYVNMQKLVALLKMMFGEGQFEIDIEVGWYSRLLKSINPLTIQLRTMARECG